MYVFNQAAFLWLRLLSVPLLYAWRMPSADTWYEICWFGSLWEAATEVMHACEKVVELFPDNGIARQGRGLARALTGNFAGAVGDFSTYLKWAPTNNQSEQDISLRQQWTEALKAHRNPFDAETLQKLRSE